jgi:hypothetical protein
MINKTDFVYSQVSEPHRMRTKQILKQFPQMRNLIGKNPAYHICYYWFGYVPGGVGISCAINRGGGFLGLPIY